MDTNKQVRAFYNSVAAIGQRDELFFDMMRAGDITKRDLRALLARNPTRYGRYAGFIDQLPE
jgi:hypothetical protein